MRGRSAASLPHAFGRLLCRLFVQVDDADGRAIFGETKSDCLTDSAGSARYQRHFVVQTKRAHSVSPLRSPETNAGIAAPTFYLVHVFRVNNKNVHFII